jgi:YidC/Oxa1 family membrane protein insertase
MAGKPQGRRDPDAMAAKRRRAWLPIVIAGVLGLILTLVVTGPGPDTKTREELLGQTIGETADSTTQASDVVDAGPASVTTEPTSTATAADDSNIPSTVVDTAEESASTSGASGESQTPATDKPATPAPTSSTLEGLRVRLVKAPSSDPPLPHLGALANPDQTHMQVSFTRVGGGISKIVFSDIWTSARAKRQAARHWKAVAAEKASPPPLPSDSERYVLAREQLLPAGGGRLDPYPILACRSVFVNGVEINLKHQTCWTPKGAGAFEAVLENGKGEKVLAIERQFAVDGWSISFEQQVTSFVAEPLDVSWSLIGPPGLSLDPGSYMDRRRFRFGYLLGKQEDPNRLAGVISDGALKVEFSDAVDEDATSTLWPNPTAEEEGYELSWFGSSSRYFAFVVYPAEAAQGGDHLSMDSQVDRITRVFDEVDGQAQVATIMYTPSLSIDGGAIAHSSLSAFAGPLERSLIEGTKPYDILRLGGLVLYRMSDFCACCTFQWLAVLLVELLSFFDHWVVFDWGVSIILLVACVRTLLHPITRRSQMGMQIFSKKMGKLKPEMDRIQKKFKDDRKRLQQEQMQLFREHGVNPLQMLGCLPMFLQTPIWIALWAALYFAFDLRQEPAFYGVFQMFGGWAFLGDLAQPDHCFWTFDKPFRLFVFEVSGINLLPFLLGGIFWVQQKYMTPRSAAMTPEQETQQKIMRIMMVVLFPVMLYSAPSGLLLYIITSSSVGIMESRFIRRKVDQMDFDTIIPAKAGGKSGAKSGKDAQSKAYQKMLDRRKQETQRKRSGPDRSFKKRK